MPLIDPTLRAALEAAIESRIDSGVKAAAYHGDEEARATAGTTFAEGNPVERAAGLAVHRIGCTGDECDCPANLSRPDPVSDRACEDAGRLRLALAIFADLQNRYTPTPGARLPGHGPCPEGACADHWRSGVQRSAAKKRYRRLCRACGDFRKRNGYPIPPLVLKALSEAGGDWSHWSVVRAQRVAAAAPQKKVG
jgi:hypothetical protein